jgi:hypothetical protein
MFNFLKKLFGIQIVKTVTSDSLHWNRKSINGKVTVTVAVNDKQVFEGNDEEFEAWKSLPENAAIEKRLGKNIVPITDYFKGAKHGS